MTNISIQEDLIQVFDTKDTTNDTVRLSLLAPKLINGEIKVYGVGDLNKTNRRDIIPIPYLGIYVCYADAKQAIAKYYEKKMGYTREQALQAVGLS
jgi:hypothetical protein